MKQGSLSDMQRAWTEYLGPLETRFPEHPYKEEVEKFRQRWETAKSAHASEAQRFFQQGELLRQQGNWAAAAQVWRNVVDVFQDVNSEREWVQRAERGLNEMGKNTSNKDRWHSVRQALKQADELRAQGKGADAERIWCGIEQLYRNDPTANEITVEVQKARHR
jgi:outer membrane protein assembly factor BamD (BamD/ComL family)